MVVVGGLAIVAYQLGRLERPVASQTRSRKPDDNGAIALRLDGPGQGRSTKSNAGFCRFKSSSWLGGTLPGSCRASVDKRD
jgi:hypothetical protein